jgi:nitrate/TMAO reductase-like tetraheme cytochrome c subunit
VRNFLYLVTRNPISLAGTSLTTISAVLFLTLFALEQVGFHGGPYLGIIAFLILPAFFVLGLLLIPVGFWRERRLSRLAKERGEAPRRFPVFDLNQDKTRAVVAIFSLATVVNVAIVAVATYKGVEVMDSTEFCGAACHSVMTPEYTTYKRSPHARVACVSCHIGPGANWFVKSKLSGSWQVVSVMFNLYPRPISVPVHDLRPARETCEQCHWPQKFVGDRLVVRTHFADDQANTELKSVLLLKIGGVRPHGAHGIHWHVDPGNRIRYRSDTSRQTIHEVELTRPDGSVTRWVGPSAKAATAEGSAEASSWRTMDCVDCHNRPTHIYRLPEQEVDLALEDGRLDRSLPYLHREAVKALKDPYPSHQAAREGLSAQLATFYRESDPQLYAARQADIERAGRVLGDIFCTDVFPEMNVTWGTYPSHIGHINTTGCFRCHDEEHATDTGETISQDCDTCHSVLAMEEENPDVLKALQEQ